jgi:hypothetical protein
MDAFYSFPGDYELEIGVFCWFGETSPKLTDEIQTAYGIAPDQS